MTREKTTVSLVLGSGGARGLAHIGVIRYLEEQGYHIASIAGSSMGAVIGGIHAAGKLHIYEDWIRTIDKFDIFSLLDFSFSGSGLVKGDRLMRKLREMIGETTIEQLPIPFTAVAADLEREREVWISRGPLFDAIRASIAMPLFFTPFDYQGTRLLDGGIFNPVPIAPTYHDLTDLTVAVSLLGPAGHKKDLPRKPEATPSNGVESLARRAREFFGRFFPDDPSREKDWDYTDIASQALDAMQGVIVRQKLAAHPPDVLIEIPRDACSLLDFDRADELIRLGYETAARALREGANG